MPNLGLGYGLAKSGMPVASHVTSNLKMLHRYNTGSVVPVSDGAFYFNDSSINFGTTITHDISEDDNSGTHTYSFWVKRTSVPISSWEAILSTQGTDGNQWIIFDNDADRLVLEAGPGDSANGTISPAMGNEWNHFAITANKTAVAVYMNGVALTVPDSVIASDFTVNCLGDNGAGSNYLRGYLCNVGIWERVLTQPEIKDIMFKNYAGLTSTNKTSLLHWWNLDEETNTSGESGTGGVKDSHGTNHGTLA